MIVVVVTGRTPVQGSLSHRAWNTAVGTCPCPALIIVVVYPLCDVWCDPSREVSCDVSSGVA